MEIIHIVLGKANPERLNGVNKVVFNMASEQCKAGKKVQVWGITPNPVHDYPERNFKTNLFKIGSLPFFISQELKKEIINYKTAVFHLHGGWVPIFSTISKYLAKNQIKYVLTPHGAYNEVAMKRSAFKKKIYFQLFEKKLIKNAHKVHSIGQSEIEGLCKIFPKANSFLLPYGFDATISNLLNKKNENFTVGFVGRIDIYTKGLDLLIEAFKKFQDNNASATLWIIGDGDGLNYLQKFIDEKNVENVILWGKKFGAEKEILISQMHVFAHPSRNEGLPTAVLEAAAQGTPTIVTYATNVAEYVSRYKAGIAIENNNVDQLEKAITKIQVAYQTGEFTDYIAGAKQMLTEVFAWSKLVNQYDELYK